MKISKFFMALAIVVASSFAVSSALAARDASETTINCDDSALTCATVGPVTVHGKATIVVKAD